MIEQDTLKMSHDEMMDTLKGLVFGTFDRTTAKERDALGTAIKALEQEPKTGHWIEHEHNGILHIECSECLSWFLRERLVRNSYCPNCGAKMVEPQEDEE